MIVLSDASAAHGRESSAGARSGANRFNKEDRREREKTPKLSQGHSEGWAPFIFDGLGGNCEMRDARRIALR